MPYQFQLRFLNDHFTWRPTCIYECILIRTYLSEQNVFQKVTEKNKKYFMSNICVPYVAWFFKTILKKVMLYTHFWTSTFSNHKQSQKHVLPKLFVVDNWKKPLLKWQRKLCYGRSAAKQQVQIPDNPHLSMWKRNCSGIILVFHYMHLLMSAYTFF